MAQLIEEMKKERKIRKKKCIRQGGAGQGTGKERRRRTMSCLFFFGLGLAHSFARVFINNNNKSNNAHGTRAERMRKNK